MAGLLVVVADGQEPMPSATRHRVFLVGWNESKPAYLAVTSEWVIA